MRTNPCKGCKNRHAECHGTCDLYLDWKEEWDEHQANLRHEKYISHLGVDKKKRFKYGN